MLLIIVTAQNGPPFLCRFSKIKWFLILFNSGIGYIITIGMDNNLFIEELPEEKQPGTHVRRINGKELTDDEMIEYYSNLVNEYGGKLTAKWVYGMVIYDGKKSKEYSWSKNHFYLFQTLLVYNNY